MGGQGGLHTKGCYPQDIKEASGTWETIGEYEIKWGALLNVGGFPLVVKEVGGGTKMTTKDSETTQGGRGCLKKGFFPSTIEEVRGEKVNIERHDIERETIEKWEGAPDIKAIQIDLKFWYDLNIKSMQGWRGS